MAANNMEKYKFDLDTNKLIDYSRIRTKISVFNPDEFDERELKNLGMELLPERIRKLRNDYHTNPGYIKYLNTKQKIDLLDINNSLESFQIKTLVHPELYREFCAIILLFDISANKGNISTAGTEMIKHCKVIYEELREIFLNFNNKDNLNRIVVQLFPSNEVIKEILDRMGNEDIDEMYMILKDKLISDYLIMS